MAEKITYFISDLHLAADQPHITQIFLKFLTQQARDAEAVYILGDLFEVWIGDDEQNELNDTIKTTLKKLTEAGVHVYIMHGNRDFLLGKQFLQQTGCQFLPDPSVIDLYGVPTLLMHGDSLCIEDTMHQRFRYFSRLPFVRYLFTRLPLSLRYKLAMTIRNKSKHRMRSLADNILDVTPAAVKKYMQVNRVKQLIHGHTHRPAIHDLEINGEAAKRIVLGAWHERGSVLICVEGVSPQLTEIE